MSHVDAAGLAALEEVAGSLRGDGIELAFARLKDPMQQRLGEIARGRSYPTVRAAVTACSAVGNTGTLASGR